MMCIPVLLQVGSGRLRTRHGASFFMMRRTYLYIMAQANTTCRFLVLLETRSNQTTDTEQVRSRTELNSLGPCQPRTLHCCPWRPPPQPPLTHSQLFFLCLLVALLSSFAPPSAPLCLLRVRQRQNATRTPSVRRVSVSYIVTHVRETVVIDGMMWVRHWLNKPEHS